MQIHTIREHRSKRLQGQAHARTGRTTGEMATSDREGLAIQRHDKEDPGGHGGQGFRLGVARHRPQV